MDRQPQEPQMRRRCMVRAVLIVLLGVVTVFMVLLASGVLTIPDPFLSIRQTAAAIGTDLKMRPK